MGLGICFHDDHVVNTVSNILPEVTDQEVTLILQGPIGGVEAGTVVTLDLTGSTFGLFTSQPDKMRGLLRIWDGVKDFPARSATLSQRLL